MVTVWVDRFAVSAKVDFPLESFLAEAAGEGLVSSVLPHVGDEVGGLTERLPAHHTFVGLLTCNTKTKAIRTKFSLIGLLHHMSNNDTVTCV